LEYLRDVQYAYALLQADVDEAQGTFIAPMRLKALPELAAADITQDWSEALSGISNENTEAFYAWLTRQGARAMSWIFSRSAISGGESPRTIRGPGIEPGEVISGAPSRQWWGTQLG
ncbi:MAG TPA: hypothetical protein VN730_11730, partial [Steroidobacteraceae bacterium]|nr:hypothetical protein [Steroidobacteraceae bacterium]